MNVYELAWPFPDAAVSWRIGSTTKDKSRGMALAYIDARDVMERLDAVCGPDGWQAEYVPMSNGTTCCRIGVLTDAGHWVWKSNGGSATGDVDNEKEREMAEKGGYSDAFKRAAVLWGIGRYLYDLDSPWVELEAKGTSHVMAPGERKKLINCHADYVRRNFKHQNAGPSDAGQRETPKAQQATGAGGHPPPSAPVRASNVPGGVQSVKDFPPEEDLAATDHTQDPEWVALHTHLCGNCESRDDVMAWWDARKKDLKARKPHFARAFYEVAILPFAASFAQTVWEDAPPPEER